MAIDYSQFSPLNFQPWATPTDPIVAGSRGGGRKSKLNTSAGIPTPGVPPTTADQTEANGQDFQGMFGPGAVDGQSVNGPAGIGPGTPPQSVALPEDNGPPPINPDQSFAGRLHDRLQRHLSGNAPEGYTESIAAQLIQQGLAPDAAYARAAREVEKARPSVLHGLFPVAGETGNDEWEKNLQRLMQGRSVSTTILANRAIQAKTQALFAQNPPPGPNATPEENGKWVDAMVPRLLGIGNFDAVKSLAPYALKPKEPGKDVGEAYRNKSTGEIQLFSKEAGTKIPLGFEKISNANAGDYQTWVDPSTVKPGSTPKYYAVPKDQVGPPGTQPTVDFRQQDTQRNVNARSDKAKTITAQNQFTGLIKDDRVKAAQYDKAYATLTRARDTTDPQERTALYGSIYSQFIQAADQPNGLRQGLLEYYESHMSPDLGSRFDIFLNKITTGTLPPKTLDALIGHLRALSKVTYNRIESQRSQFLKTHDQEVDETHLPTTKSWFPSGVLPKGVGDDAESPEARLKKMGIDLTPVPGVKP
jgi:hypothetical protein